MASLASSPNQKVYFMPVEATGLLASVGGIAELARDAIKSPAAAAPPAVMR